MEPNLQLLKVVGACAALLLSMPAPGSLAAAAEDGCPGRTSEVRGAGVADARSVRLQDGRVLRLAGIEPFGVLLPDSRTADAALVARLNSIVDGGPLQIAVLDEKPDRYGRIPATLATTDGGIVQEALAREGLAIAFPTGDPVPCFDRILAAEDSARRGRRGFWKGYDPPRARPEELRRQIGRMAIFEGVAVSVGNRPYRTYLNFGGRWSEDVTVEIEAGDRARFGGELGLANLSGKRLRVRGWVEERGGPMVTVRSPLQMQAIEAEVERGTP